MSLRKPFHVTVNGGSIHCLDGLSGRIFRACSANQGTYTGDLNSAKSILDLTKTILLNFFLLDNRRRKSHFSVKQLSNGILMEVSPLSIWLGY